MLVAVDLVEGGVLCRRCRGDGRCHRRAGPDAADPRRGTDRVLAEPRSPVTDEVAALATEAMESHLDRRLRSVQPPDRWHRTAATGTPFGVYVRVPSAGSAATAAPSPPTPTATT